MQPWIPTVGFAGTLACLVLGGIGWRRSRGAGSAERAGAAILPAAFWILTGVLACELVRAPQLDANGARLAPSYGLREGYALYYGPSEGPILSVIYAPFANLYYLLTTFAREPNSAILTASALAALSFLAPCAIVLRRRGGEANGAVVKLMTIALFGFVAVESKPIRDAVFYIHGDAPAIGLSALACLFLTAPRTGVKHLTGAALCAALAFWSKQTFVVLLVAVPLLAWILTDGRRALLTGALGLAIAAAVGCALPAVVDMRAMLFNAVEIPARHPYAMKADLPTVLAATLDDFSQFAVWPTLAALFLVVWTLRAAPATGWRERLRAEPGMVVLLTAAALLPTSFVGRMKLGGANVSFAPTLTLLALAVGLLTLSNTAREGAFSVAIRPVLAAGLALVTILHAAFPVNLATRIEELSTAPQQEAYEFAKSHPGQAYFPWFPLPTILAEKKLYHSTYAIFDREIAGYRPSFEHVRSVFPDTLRYIAYKDIYVNILQSYFPEFTKVITVDGLPGWNVYSR